MKNLLKNAALIAAGGLATYLVGVLIGAYLFNFPLFGY